MIYQLWQRRTQRLHLFVELKPVVRSVELSLDELLVLLEDDGEYAHEEWV